MFLLACCVLVSSEPRQVNRSEHFFDRKQKLKQRSHGRSTKYIEGKNFELEEFFKSKGNRPVTEATCEAKDTAMPS